MSEDSKAKRILESTADGKEEEEDLGKDGNITVKCVQEVKGTPKNMD